MGALFVTSLCAWHWLQCVGLPPQYGLLWVAGVANESLNWISLRANGRCWPGWRN